MSKPKGYRRSIYLDDETQVLLERAAKKAGIPLGKFLVNSAIVFALRGETPKVRSVLQAG